MLTKLWGKSNKSQVGVKDVVRGNNNLKSISTQANVPVSLTTKSGKNHLYSKKQAKVNKINYG